MSTKVQHDTLYGTVISWVEPFFRKDPDDDSDRVVGGRYMMPVEAFRLTADDIDDDDAYLAEAARIVDWMEGEGAFYRDGYGSIRCRGGGAAYPGDWIVRHRSGKFSVYSDERFKEVFTPA